MSSLRENSVRGLVADDDPLIRMVLRVALEARGIDVFEAASGMEALEVVDAVDFGVIDARMPGLSLAETINALRATRWIPLLVLSGGTVDANLLGDVEYLMKPIELDAFLAAVDRLLAASAPDSGEDVP